MYRHLVRKYDAEIFKNSHFRVYLFLFGAAFRQSVLFLSVNSLFQINIYLAFFSNTAIFFYVVRYRFFAIKK